MPADRCRGGASSRSGLIYAGIMTVVFAVFFRDGDRLLPILGGLLVSGPLYLLLGYVLAKFGYTPQDARPTCARRGRRRRSPAGADDGDAGRARAGADRGARRPAPTATRRRSA